MTRAEMVDAVLLYHDGEPLRIVEQPTRSGNWMLSDVLHAAMLLHERKPTLVAPGDVAAVLGELAARE